MKNKTQQTTGWLDNFNDSKVSLPPGFVGEGVFNGPQWKSPAWGGQFKDGGDIPQAQDGLWSTNKKAYVDSALSANKNLDWVKRLYDSNLKSTMVPGEKSPSTHRMGDNDQGYVFPTIVNMNGQLVDLGDRAEDYARETNTGIQFPKEQGTWFARSTDDKSGYKMGTGVLKGKPVMQKYKSVDKKAMGGNIPGSVGFTYARTIDPAPSEGKYAKKTLPSAQNGQEMSFYQNGLDFKTKGMKNGGWLDKYEEGGIVKDDMGYWNPDNHGKVVEIGGNDITMEGVDQPLIGISDEGDQKYMLPGKNYKFKGNKVREYPVAQNGVRQEQKGLINLDDLTNFTNYNTPKAQAGTSMGQGKMQTRSGETMTYDQAAKILKTSLAPMVAEKAEYINSPLYKKRLTGMGEKDPNQVVKDRLQELKKLQFSSYDPRGNAKVKESSPSTTGKRFTSDKSGKTTGDYPSISLGVGWTPTSAAHELGHVTSSQSDRFVNTPYTGTGENMSPAESNEFLRLSKAKPEFKAGALSLYDSRVRTNPVGSKYDTDAGSSFASMKGIDEHSIGSGEAKGDLDAVRYLFKKQGVTKKYGENITPETLKKAQQNKKIQGDEFFQRLKKRFSDEDIIKLNNEIAQNDANPQELSYAKLGTKLKTKGWLDKY